MLILNIIFDHHVWQVEFLNSVIVDLQRKNEELKSNLEKMAEAALNGNTASEMDNHERWTVLCFHFSPQSYWSYLIILQSVYT